MPELIILLQNKWQRPSETIKLHFKGIKFHISGVLKQKKANNSQSTEKQTFQQAPLVQECLIFQGQQLKIFTPQGGQSCISSLKQIAKSTQLLRIL